MLNGYPPEYATRKKRQNITVRGGAKVEIKGILQPFTVEQRIPLKAGYQVVYNLEMIFALTFQINTYPTQQLREYIISRLFQSEKSMIICMMNGNHKSYLKC